MRVKRDPDGFGGRLDMALMERQMTIAKFAKKIGYSVSSVDQWLAGKAEPGLCAIRSTASVLNVSADWLCGLTPFNQQRF